MGTRLQTISCICFLNHIFEELSRRWKFDLFFHYVDTTTAIWSTEAVETHPHLFRSNRIPSTQWTALNQSVCLPIRVFKHEWEHEWHTNGLPVPSQGLPYELWIAEQLPCILSCYGARGSDWRLGPGRTRLSSASCRRLDFEWIPVVISSENTNGWKILNGPLKAQYKSRNQMIDLQGYQRDRNHPFRKLSSKMPAVDRCVMVAWEDLVF